MLILASKSPRRKSILESMNIVFTVSVPYIDEHTDGVFYEDIPILNACMKADAAAEEHPDMLVLAADTVVEYAGRHFNKPVNQDDAVQMLMTLSGQEHRVVTGVCIRLLSKKISTVFADHSLVKFKNYGLDTVTEYISKVNVMDKAGSYAVQEEGSLIIDSIKGSVSNVMGLPSEKLAEALSVIKCLCSFTN